MRTSVSCLVVSVALLVASGCGGSKSSVDAGTDGATQNDMSASALTACTAEANALCALRNTCSPSYGIAKNYGTLSMCETRTAQVCVNALDAKGTGASVATVDACAGAYSTEACTDYFDSNPVALCIPPNGTLDVGSACGASAQCTSGYCAVGQYAVCGTCSSLPVVGATCEVQADCGRDLACAIPTVPEDDGGVSTSGVCAAWVANGGACLTGRNPCQNGYACVGENQTTGATGTCMPLVTTLNGACDANRKTAADCDTDDDLACIPTATGSGVGTCQAITFVSTGATCGDIGSAPITGRSVCSAGGLCVKAVSTDPTGTCVAPAADGAACDNDPSLGPPCLAPAKCVTSGSGTAGVCTVPNAATCM